MAVLEQAGLVEVEKGYAGRRPRTWVRITRTGRHALTAELTALSILVADHQAAAANNSPAQHSGPAPT